MAVNKESNGYTIFFSIVMVVVVGSALTLLSLGLKPYQKKNEADKKKMDILAAIGIGEDQGVKRKTANAEFDKYITETLVINSKGEVIEGADALQVDVKKEFRDKTMDKEKKQFPLYVAQVDGKTYNVIPMAGTGLWGPIWGYVALEADNITVYGASFDHKTETPGLGAEIKESFFEDPWKGKKIWDGDSDETKSFTSVMVRKGGVQTGTDNEIHQVSAITGGTITSNGVNEMAKRTFGIYRNYLKPKF